MKAKNIIQLVFIATSLLLCISCKKDAQPAKPEQAVNLSNGYTKTSGRNILDGTGNPIYIKGVQIEGWLSVPSHMWGAGLSGETKIYEGLTQLIGTEKAMNFRKEIVKNFISKDDIAAIKNSGFNTVRVPINHIALDKYYDGWDALDTLVSWCEQYKIYIVLSLHSAPSPQSTLFPADYVFPEPVLWDDAGKRTETVNLWRKIALRYKDKKIIAAYDLLNEPDPPVAKKDIFISLNKEIIYAIRDVDKDHLLFVEGSSYAKDFSYFSSRLPDNNICYEFHTYNWFGESFDNQLRDFQNFSKLHNVPIINGEFGAVSNSQAASIRREFEDTTRHINGWVFWAWKSYYLREGDWFGGLQNKDIHYLREFDVSPEWKKVMNYVSGTLFAPKPTAEETLDGMNDFINRIKLKNTQQNDDIKRSLIY
ncbi:MAG TPA: cellulase family glycosylhydrolase [Cytophagaceae bacterium]|jgi:hypothetical protein